MATSSETSVASGVKEAASCGMTACHPLSRFHTYMIITALAS